MDLGTKDKIVSCAEDLFFTKGFKSTSLKDISKKLNIKPASLYYHFPNGKEEIYLEVLTRRLNLYKRKIELLANENKEIGLFLLEFANWFIEQPPMNMTLIAEIDMPYLTPKAKQAVTGLIAGAIFSPLREVFHRSKHELKEIEPMRLVGLYINLLNGMSFALKKRYTDRKGLVRDYVEVLMYGMTMK